MPIREREDLELWSRNQNKEFYLQNTEDFGGAYMLDSNAVSVFVFILVDFDKY